MIQTVRVYQEGAKSMCISGSFFSLGLTEELSRELLLKNLHAIPYLASMNWVKTNKQANLHKPPQPSAISSMRHQPHKFKEISGLRINNWPLM